MIGFAGTYTGGGGAGEGGGAGGKIGATYAGGGIYTDPLPARGVPDALNA
jgi:hypothetical protein